jgi:D-inositol-3-phosphate glycosyltransferase
MISFVWSAKYPFIAGSGGSENYTAGHIRELRRRGIASRVITIGHGTNDGRDDFPDISFKNLDSPEKLTDLDDLLIFVTYPLSVKTKRRSYVILHCPPVSMGAVDPLFNLKALANKTMLAPSKFSATLWEKYSGRKIFHIPAVYPFAENSFSRVVRPVYTGQKIRLLFGGRLTPDKGIYTLLAALHMPEMLKLDYELTVTGAGSNSDTGHMIKKLLEVHPNLTLIHARKTPQAMAELMANHDIVLMPSTNIFWQESFGILSVEAQHAGCRVVGSNAGGLPETDTGSLLLVRPDDPRALSQGISLAVAMGPVSAAERAHSIAKFTVKASVDQLLNIVAPELRRKGHPDLAMDATSLGQVMLPSVLYERLPRPANCSRNLDFPANSD